MKKIISLMLILMFSLCLCACGENNKDAGTYESSNDSPITSASSQTTTESNNDSQITSTPSQDTTSTTDTVQNTVSYKLPTANEFVDSFKVLFTLSDIREEKGTISFKTSTGEQLFGYINDLGKVNKILVHSSGKDVATLIQEVYHFYPVCQYLSDVMGENIKVDAIMDVVNAVEPISNTTDLSKTMTWNNRKDGVGYQLSVCQYSSMNYSTMDFTIEIY